MHSGVFSGILVYNFSHPVCPTLSYNIQYNTPFSHPLRRPLTHHSIPLLIPLYYRFLSGVHRFDFLQNKENARNFVLVEVYSNKDAPVEHKATQHYATVTCFIPPPLL